MHITITIFIELRLSKKMEQTTYTVQNSTWFYVGLQYILYSTKLSVFSQDIYSL